MNIEAMVDALNFWNSIVIVVVFSFIVVFADEWVLKPMRTRRWEKAAASGDKEKAELLRLARSANVQEE
jgi:hypothetical protein